MEYRSKRTTPPPLVIKKSKDGGFMAWFYKLRDRFEFRLTWRWK